MSQSPVVRAIDIGYGNTKFVTSHPPGGEIATGLFPSVAPQKHPSADLAGGVLERRRTVLVKIGQVTYEVGTDASLAQDASHGRTLDASFARSDTYLALLRGALYYMGSPAIDLLVLGLPVNTYAQHAKYLSTAMVGEHVIPNSRARLLPDEAPEIAVTVKAVRVFPQPLGGFFDHAIRGGLVRSMRVQTNLLIDPGFFTLDWLVTKGTKPMDARSGAHPGGMSAILRGIAEALARDLGKSVVDIGRLDEALLKGIKPRYYGKDRDISAYLPSAKSKIREYVSVLANKVGAADDIDNIIVGGGGAHFFLDAIKEKFPEQEFTVSKDPIFANVRGFQLAGEEMIRIANAAAKPAAA